MPHLYLLPYITIGGFVGLLLASAYSDVKRLIIPNQYTIAIALLFPAYGLSSPGSVDWLGSAAVAGGLLALGFFLFCKKVTGGGDVKLVAATALWAGPELVLPFLLFTGIAGGAMAAGIWLRYRLSAAGTPLSFLSVPARKEFYDQPMPYGVAIAAGGLYVAFTLIS